MVIYRKTVSETLWSILNELMSMEEFNDFRLVGGTSLSLILGHRISVDIDLFTDLTYGSVDFGRIKDKLNSTFTYVESNMWMNKDTIGNSCYVGHSKNNLVKLDLYYTDPFIYPILSQDGIRFSTLEEIAAMKMDVIALSGRKKDFWDIHELMNKFSIDEILSYYNKRYPYGIEKKELIYKLTDFDNAEKDFDPICLKGKYWQLIKLDIENAIK